ncbi:hypothetical protein [Actinomadura parmotrematis]|uniref:Uncharacterized protein n=1 Tax=Actinomadura parmotrematis TaxID=2864039 RepID=A0ABS7FNQ4_9ACTN|nr:hypothetical protein [Actinomadura parmotrematis]MBW8481999.1 hypothetical protein [Actinomadura parmotrematis]
MAQQGSYSARDVLVFDQGTGALLSRQTELVEPGGPCSARRPGFVIDYAATRAGGWTGGRPQPPAGAPS